MYIWSQWHIRLTYFWSQWHIRLTYFVLFPSTPVEGKKERKKECK